MRKPALFQARGEDGREFEAFGVGEREQAHLRALIHCIGIGHERRMVEKIRHAFAALRRFGRRAGQLIKVFEAAFGFGRVLLLEHLAIASASLDEPQAIVQSQRGQRRGQPFQQLAESNEGRGRAGRDQGGVKTTAQGGKWGEGEGNGS